MSKRLALTLVMTLIIFVTAGVAILLAKGYTFSTGEKRIIGTGIISATSVPDSASVYLDGHLTTATDATISSLPPKKYNVRIVKEGFIPWENEIEVKEGLVSEVEVTLFPAIPTIYPLTFNGIKNPILSPDGSKLAFVVPTGKKSGVWVWTMSTNVPIAFARSAEPHQIALNTPSLDLSESVLQWSPDSKEIVATVGLNSYLLDSDRLNTEPRDITPTLETTLNTWKEDTAEKDAAGILAIKDLKVRKIASDSAILKWSPDETKFMYSASKDPVSSSEAKLKFKVYDLENKKSFDIPDAILHFWLPDSRHIVLVEDGDVAITDFDGTNKAVIFAGKFLNDFVFAWPDSSRLVLISTFPTPTASEPNLYGINLK